jgi:deoxycytidine triphosphate deaminase
MILGIDKLHQLVKEKKLVEGLCQRELNNPEGAGFDLRIGSLYKISSGGYLGIEEREASEMELLAEHKEGEKTTVILEPGEHYVMRTVEKVNTPDNLMILFRPRITLFRCGVTVFTGNCSPGYCGPLFFAIYNMSKHPFKLEMGSRVVHAMFYRIDGSSNLYRGQWQHGRVNTEGKETQV